jgi:hypothetical protein
MQNKTLIKKADMVLGDIASAGRLSDEQAATFIRTLINQPTVIAGSRVVVMTAPTRKISKIKFGSRIMRAGTENTRLAVGDRSKVTTSEIELNSKEVIAEVLLPYAVIEDNIEGGNVNFGGDRAEGGIVNTILALIAERAALDLEEWALHADTTSGDAYLALTDGWLKRMTSHTVNHGAGISRDMFKRGVQALPNPYKRNLAELKHFVSHNNLVEYADSLADRETAMGDAKHQRIAENWGAGVPVTGVALLDDTEGFLTHNKNLIFGIQRDLSFEYEKLISERQYKIVVTARLDVQIEEEDATVAYTNITAPV